MTLEVINKYDVHNSNTMWYELVQWLIFILCEIIILIFLTFVVLHWMIYASRLIVITYAPSIERKVYNFFDSFIERKVINYIIVFCSDPIVFNVLSCSDPTSVQFFIFRVWRFYKCGFFVVYIFKRFRVFCATLVTCFRINYHVAFFLGCQNIFCIAW